MGKIRVQDLSRMIGMNPQDLMFKLRSIGVRIEGEDSQVDTEVLKAVLEGKRLATPREVIVRDEDSARSAAAQARPGAPSAPRPSEPPQPRRRAIIHKVEAPIPTLPSRERHESTGRPDEDMVPAASAGAAGLLQQEPADEAVPAPEPVAEEPV